MKKRKFIGIIGILLYLTCIFSSCNTAKLDTPDGFSIDESYKLTWNTVLYARSYVVQITDEKDLSIEYSAKRAYYSLASLEEGDYEICVKAIGGGDYGNSALSEPFYFHKDYETGCLYTLINSGSEYELTKVGTASGSFEIESVYRGKPVTSIAEGAFKGSSNVEAVVIGKNVQTIGDKAFYNCTKLVSISIPEKVTTIGKAAFQACRALTEVALPNGLTTIEENTFSYCRGLTKVTLGENLAEIGDYAFSECSTLTKIVLPNTVTKLGEYVFSGNSALTCVTLGNSIEKVADYAFYRCGALTSIQFGDESSLSEIGKYAFAYCESLKEIEIPEAVTVIDSGAFYHDSSLDNVALPKSLTRIGGGAFTETKLYKESLEEEECIYIGNWLVACDVTWKTNLKEINSKTFQENIVGIADEVFYNCTQIEKISFPSTLKYIGKYAFYENTGLWSVSTYKNSVEIIWDRAFANCTTLSSLSLKEGLIDIGNYAFYNCKLLANKETLIPDTVERVGMYAFKNTKLWNDVTGNVVYAGNWIVGYTGDIETHNITDEETIGIADYAFYKCETLQNISNLSQIVYIGKGAFYGCVELVGGDLNDGIKEIQDYTFYNCSSLYNVSIPLDLISIGRSAFYKCEKLNSVDLSNSNVDKIGAYAFYGCTNLRSAQLGTNLENLGEYAFYKCSSLVSVTIPKSLKEIEKRAFYKCESMTALYLSEGLEKIGEAAFSGCSALEEIVLPDSVQIVGKNAFYNCSSVANLVIGKNVKEIGGYAFYGLKEIQSLYIPVSVQKIGKYAFKGCASVQSLTLRADMAIDAHAFYGCTFASIYTDGTFDSDNWHSRWNSSYRPVIEGCVLSEDGYVLSVTASVDFIKNEKTGNIVAPQREGYSFVGWTTQEGGTIAEYVAEDLANVIEGSVLYAVWVIAESEANVA